MLCSVSPPLREAGHRRPCNGAATFNDRPALVADRSALNDPTTSFRGNRLFGEPQEHRRSLLVFEPDKVLGKPRVTEKNLQIESQRLSGSNHAHP